MRIERRNHQGFAILTVADRVTADTPMEPLVAAVESAIEEGQGRVAFCFTASSYLSTRSIAALVQCCGLIEKAAGELAIINPNQDMLDTLETTGLDRIIRVADSEEALGS